MRRNELCVCGKGGPFHLFLLLLGESIQPTSSLEVPLLCLVTPFTPMQTDLRGLKSIQTKRMHTLVLNVLPALQFTPVLESKSCPNGRPIQDRPHPKPKPQPSRSSQISSTTHTPHCSHPPATHPYTLTPERKDGHEAPASPRLGIIHSHRGLPHLFLFPLLLLLPPPAPLHGRSANRNRERSLRGQVLPHLHRPRAPQTTAPAHHPARGRQALHDHHQRRTSPPPPPPPLPTHLTLPHLPQSKQKNSWSVPSTSPPPKPP